MNAAYRILGYRRIRCPAGQVTRFLNLCLKLGTDLTDFSMGAEGATFVCRPRAAGRLKAAAARAGVTLSVGELCGLPRLCRRVLGHPGFLCGAVLALALYLLAGRAVWCVEVTGNERLSAEDVIAELDAVGFGVGTRIAGVDTRRLENEVLMASEDISWISICMSGQVARVQIREVLPTEILPDDDTPSNLVATADGQIERLELLGGTPVVGIGQAVLKGELLVSGITDSQTQGLRMTRAGGAVWARVTHEIEVEIPFRYTEKTETGEVQYDREIIFYKKYINFFKNTGNHPPICDTIEWIRMARLPGGRILPLGVKTTAWVGYAETPAERTPEEAMTLAYEELARSIAGLHGELIRKNIVTEITDDAYRLTCRVTVIENIAEERPIGTEDR